ncbi:MAG: hypothetical protein ACKO96_15215 [Flammeovirgaceae bacterium]
MTEETFFKNYLPALEKAIESSPRYKSSFEIHDADFFIENENTRNSIDEFIESNYSEYSVFFDDIFAYFDINAHGIESHNGVSLEEVKRRIEKSIVLYKKKFNL